MTNFSVTMSMPSRTYEIEATDEKEAKTLIEAQYYQDIETTTIVPQTFIETLGTKVPVPRDEVSREFEQNEEGPQG